VTVACGGSSAELDPWRGSLTRGKAENSVYFPTFWRVSAFHHFLAVLEIFLETMDSTLLVSVLCLLRFAFADLPLSCQNISLTGCDRTEPVSQQGSHSRICTDTSKVSEAKKTESGNVKVEEDGPILPKASKA
jgi:hypothetical protein